MNNEQFNFNTQQGENDEPPMNTPDNSSRIVEIHHHHHQSPPPLPSEVSRTSSISTKRITASLCGIFLGGLGIHKFVLGYNTAGIIMLVISLVTFGLAYPIVHLIGFIEGIIYLVNTDQKFEDFYIKNKTQWF